MSFKRKRERPCIAPGMPSTSSGFTHKPQIKSINKAQQFYFRSNNFFFIFCLPTLISHKERTRELSLSEIHRTRKGLGRFHETSNKYTCFQKIVLLFQRIAFILENYNQQNRSLYLKKLQSAKPLPTSQKITTRKQPFMAKTTRKRKGKLEKEKIGEKRYSIRSDT